MSGPRLDNETYEEYKGRLRKEWIEERLRKSGVLSQIGPAINRTKYRALLRSAQRELRAARGDGYTDEQILNSLRSGDEAQKAYADFIEFEIMKRG